MNKHVSIFGLISTLLISSIASADVYMKALGCTLTGKSQEGAPKIVELYIIDDRKNAGEGTATNGMMLIEFQFGVNSSSLKAVIPATILPTETAVTAQTVGQTDELFVLKLESKDIPQDGCKKSFKATVTQNNSRTLAYTCHCTH